MDAQEKRKKFQITDSTPPFEPPSKSLPVFTTMEGLNSNVGREYSDTHYLFIHENAMRQISEHIGWGIHTQTNYVEQGGLLLGSALWDEKQGILYGVVEMAIAGKTAKGSSAHLEMSHETWKEMLDSVDDLLSKNPKKDLRIIGWYHTHPNDLGVFMSGTDQDTQRRFFANDWQFAVVMNPHRRIWRSFYGRHVTECAGFVVTEPKHIPQEEEKKARSEKPHNDNQFVKKDNAISPGKIEFYLRLCAILLIVLLLLQVTGISLQIFSLLRQ